MVIGNNPQVTASLFKPQYTMAAVIANEFTEAADDLYLSALIEIGLVLFVITLIINALSRLLIWSVTRERKGQDARAGRDDGLQGAEGGGMNLTARRKVLSGLVVFLCGGGGACVALVPLFFVFVYVLQRGFSSPRTGTSSRRCRSPSASPAAAWPTRSSARSYLIGIASAIGVPGRHRRRRLSLRVRHDAFRRARALHAPTS